MSTPDIEILTAIFKTGDDSTYHNIAVYRSPNGNFEFFLENIESTLSKINKHNERVHIIGDFNIDLYRPERKNSK